MDLHERHDGRSAWHVSLLETGCEARASGGRAVTFEEMMGEVGDFVDLVLAKARARTISMMIDEGATDSEIRATLNWIDAKHDDWKDAAIDDLRARVIEGFRETRH